MYPIRRKNGQIDLVKINRNEIPSHKNNLKKGEKIVRQHLDR